MRHRRQRKLARRFAPSYGGVSREKERDSRNAVVEVRAETNELKDLGVPQPIKANPGGARAAANGVTRQFFGDLVGLPGEKLLCRRDRNLVAQKLLRLRGLWRRSGGPRNCARILPDNCRLPGDVLLVETSNTGAGAFQSRGGIGIDGNAGRIANIVAVTARHKMRHVQREERGAFGALQCPKRVGLFSQSTSRATKSACADQITPSSIDR